MKPYSREDAEAELADAVHGGDWALIERLAVVVDRLTPVRTPSLGGAALWYAEAGLGVFPVQPGGKVPFPRSRGCKDATSDPDQVRAWWTEHPTANVGIATGYVVDVIDFDGPEAHAAWGRKFPDPERPWGKNTRPLAIVSTPRPGGLHAYVPAAGIGNAAGFLPSVDYRGEGGYVLAPPSVLDDRSGQHPGSYRFIRPLNPKDL